MHLLVTALVAIVLLACLVCIMHAPCGRIDADQAQRAQRILNATDVFFRRVHVMWPEVLTHDADARIAYMHQLRVQTELVHLLITSEKFSRPLRLLASIQARDEAAFPSMLRILDASLIHRPLATVARHPCFEAYKKAL